MNKHAYSDYMADPIQREARKLFVIIVLPGVILFAVVIAALALL